MSAAGQTENTEVVVENTPPVVDAPPAVPPPAEAPPPDSSPRWALERIDRLTADKKDLERKLAEASKTAGTPAVAGSPPTSAAAIPPVPAVAAFDAMEIDRRATEIAEQRVAQQTLESRVNGIASEGMKAHPTDWAITIQNLQRINAISPDIVNIAHDLGNAHEIIFNLGKDMNEAARIAGLPAAQQGAALARFAMKLTDTAPANVSRAPAPIVDGVGGNAPQDGLRDDLSMEEWANRRNAERSKKRA